MLADDDDSDEQDFANNSDDNDDVDDNDEYDENDDDDRYDSSNGTQPGGRPSDEDTKNSNISSELDNKWPDSTTSDAEPPTKRKKLDEAKSRAEQMENGSSENNNGSAEVGKSVESVSPQSRRRKMTYSPKNKHDDVERWADAIIKYHKQTEELRTRYASFVQLCKCSVSMC